MQTFGTLMLLAGLILLVGVSAAGALRVWQEHRAKAWSRRPHACVWQPTRILGTLQDPVRTVLIEECQRCTAARLMERDGVWVFNRFGHLVNTAGEIAALRRMFGHDQTR